MGDCDIEEAEGLVDPCPLPGSSGHRSLNDNERRLYAPMNDLDGFVLDKDAVYVEIPDWKVHYSKESIDADTEGDQMIRTLQAMDVTLDEKLRETDARLFDFTPAPQLGTSATEMLEEGSSSEDEPLTVSETQNVKMPRYETVKEGGRVRRRVLFADEFQTDQRHSSPSDQLGDSESDWSVEDTAVGSLLRHLAQRT